MTTGTHHWQEALLIAGHANGATTMHYAVVKDAQMVKSRIKLNY